MAVPAYGQTLDEKAWNAVWDRLEKQIPAGNAENIIHILEVPIPATWAARDEEGLRELQRYAGAIPENTYVLDPSRQSQMLHQVYASYVLDLELPTGTAEQRKAFLAASDGYAKAYGEYSDTLKTYLAAWDKRQAQLTAQGKPIDDLARLRFRGEEGDIFVAPRNHMKDAFLEVQKFAPVAQYWVSAVQRLNSEVAGAESQLRDLYTYEGGFATLSAISTKPDCNDDVVTGWTKITFTKDVRNEQTRQTNWNGNGGWGGSFFDIGGGANGSRYDHWLDTQNDSISVGFCNLTYIALAPGGWWYPAILEAIDSGKLALKKGSPFSGKKALGPKGTIPYIVKGAIVARRITFVAQLGTGNLHDYKEVFSGNGGVRVGPWHVGGSGGSTTFGSESTNATGGYVRSTNFDVPAIVAIVTEPTKDANSQNAPPSAAQH
jgi:hypothetical protein